MDITHNSLTIDTLLLYEKVFTMDHGIHHKIYTRYMFTKMVEDFFLQYSERITIMDLTQFKANCL